MEHIVAEVHRRNAVVPDRAPLLGRVVGEGSFGRVFLFGSSHSGQVIKVLPSAEHCEEWCVFDSEGRLFQTCGPRRRNALKFAVDIARHRPEMAHVLQVDSVEWHPDPSGRMLHLNGYLNETLAALAITKQLVEPGYARNFVRCFDAWRTERNAHMIFDRCHESTSNLSDVMTFMDWKVLFLIVIANLHVAQTVLQFKHHDLHLDNVMVQYLRRPPAGTPLPKVSEGIVVADESISPLPLRAGIQLRHDLQFECPILLNGSAMPYITDYGMASWGTMPRVQRIDLAHFNGSKKFGEYHADLEGYRGYDIQLLVGDALDLLRRKVGVSDARNWLTRLQRMVHSGGARSNRLGRAPPGRASDIPPIALLESDLFSEFRVAFPSTEAMSVVNMISSA